MAHVGLWRIFPGVQLSREQSLVQLIHRILQARPMLIDTQRGAESGAGTPSRSGTIRLEHPGRRTTGGQGQKWPSL